MAKTTDYIIDENPEVAMGEAHLETNRIFKAFPALKHKNYQLYFGGQLVSLIGTWLQTVAQGWLVFQLTHDAFMVGSIAAIGTLPSLFFSLFGGVIVDRFPKKTILMFTQVASMILAFLLGFLTVTNLITVWEIGVIGLLLGVVNSLDGPARLSFAVELVGKEDLHSAIALNAGMFNAARVVGPAVAGILIAIIGAGGAFIANAVSFIAVIIAMVYMNVEHVSHQVHPNPLKAIKEGVVYSYTHPMIRTLLLYAGITSVFGWSYTTIMPVIAGEVFHQDASGLGTLYVATGLGAILGTILVSSVSKKMDSFLFIFIGSVIFVSGIIGFSLMSNFYAALPFLFLSGLGLIMQFATMNTTIQRLVPDNLRGRVMSIYSLMFLGLTPFGSFEIGYLAKNFGSMEAMRINVSALAIVAVTVFLLRDKIKAAHTKYDSAS